MDRVKSSKWKVGAGASVLALAVVAVGCGSSSKASTAGTTATTATTISSSNSSSTAPGSATTASCSGIPSGPIKLGNILPLSNNPYSQIEQLTSADTGIAVSYFNAHDSICGHQVQVVQSDDKGDPATSLSLGRQMVSQGIKIMLNPSLGPTEDAIQPYLMQQKMLIVSISGITSSLAPTQNPSYFSVLPSDAEYAMAAANEVKTKGWNNVGILNDGTDFGNDYNSYLQKDLRADGITIVKTVDYSPTAVDLTAPLQELKSAGAKTILPASASGITALVSSMKQLGFPSQTLSWGAYLDYFIPQSSLPSGTVDGCTWYLPASSAPASTTGEPATAHALLTQASSTLGKAAPDFGVIQAYVQLQVIKAIVENAGSLDSSKLLAAATSVQNLPTVWPGISETLTASDHTGYPQGKYGMCQLTLGPQQVEYLAS